VRVNLTTTEARDLDHADLLARIDAMLAPYDPPQVETQGEKIARLSRTLDEMPAIYRWLLTLWSWCAHWTDAMAQQMGQRDARYQALRQRRDLLEKMAAAAKLRYEAASRIITVLESFDVTGMPRTRKGQ